MSDSSDNAPDAVEHHDIDPEILATQTHGWTVREWLEVDVHARQRRMRRILFWWIALAWRLRYIGAEHVPTEGEVLMCPNHTHWVDSWIQGLGHPRDVRWMGKSDLLDPKIIGPFLRRNGVFPVRRGQSDSAAINLAELVLRDGQLLVVFPEGTRCRTHGGGWGVPRSGAARLALATGCRIIPTATYGLQPGTGRTHLPSWLRWLPFSTRVTTVYGAPISVPAEVDPSRERIAEVRDLIWEQIIAAYERARAATD